MPYFPFHYCTMASKNLEWLSIIVQIVLTAVLFIALGVAAESFFCPALSVISDSLKVREAHLRLCSDNYARACVLNGALARLPPTSSPKTSRV